MIRPHSFAANWQYHLRWNQAGGLSSGAGQAWSDTQLGLLSDIGDEFFSGPFCSYLSTEGGGEVAENQRN